MEKPRTFSRKLLGIISGVTPKMWHLKIGTNPATRLLCGRNYGHWKEAMGFDPENAANITNLPICNGCKKRWFF